MTPRPARLGVGIVGAGRVGAVLGAMLRSAGHSIVGVSAVSDASRDRAEQLLPGVPIVAVEEVVERAELVLLAVPDDALEDLVTGLSSLGQFSAGQIVVHTAGRFGTQVLEPARAAGAIPLAIHPAMTFTGTAIDIERLVDARFAVSADPQSLPIGLALVVELGGEPVVIENRDRSIYHAALAHGANHLVTTVAQARALLAGLGIAEPGAVLGPLVHAALDGAVRGGDAALTGPVSRGDAGTVAEHLRALAGADPDVAPAYIALARATADRCERNGRITSAQAAEVRTALSGHGTAAAGPRVLNTIDELKAALTPRRRAVVMTMGALHAGHLELVRRAAQLAAEVVVTIFVNPLQFGAGEDLDRYPRTLDADVAALTDLGVVDIVFAPPASQLYPDGDPQVRISAGPMGQMLEGAVRPGHFDGMLTVVHKLLQLTSPDVALFGQKDAQQLALIRRMVADLNLGVEIVAVPIVRESDGLALSSRNVYLTPPQRQAALALSRAMVAGERAAAAGPQAVLDAATAELGGDDIAVDYLALVDPTTMTAADPAEPTRATLLAVAAKVGTTRLIDNAVIHYPCD